MLTNEQYMQTFRKLEYVFLNLLDDNEGNTYTQDHEDDDANANTSCGNAYGNNSDSNDDDWEGGGPPQATPYASRSLHDLLKHDNVKAAHYSNGMNSLKVIASACHDAMHTLERLHERTRSYPMLVPVLQRKNNEINVSFRFVCGRWLISDYVSQASTLSPYDQLQHIREAQEQISSVNEDLSKFSFCKPIEHEFTVSLYKYIFEGALLSNTFKTSASLDVFTIEAIISYIIACLMAHIGTTFVASPVVSIDINSKTKIMIHAERHGVIIQINDDNPVLVKEYYHPILDERLVTNTSLYKQSNFQVHVDFSKVDALIQTPRAKEGGMGDKLKKNKTPSPQSRRPPGGLLAPKNAPQAQARPQQQENRLADIIRDSLGIRSAQYIENPLEYIVTKNFWLRPQKLDIEGSTPLASSLLAKVSPRLQGGAVPTLEYFREGFDMQDPLFVYNVIEKIITYPIMNYNMIS